MFSFVKHDTIICYYISLCFYQTCFVVAVLQPHRPYIYHKSESTPKRHTTLSALNPFHGDKGACLVIKSSSNHIVNVQYAHSPHYNNALVKMDFTFTVQQKRYASYMPLQQRILLLVFILFP